MTKNWQIAEKHPLDFRENLQHLSPIVTQILWNRGLRTKEEVEDFLNPDWSKHVHDAQQFRHMRGAMDRVFQAIEKGERITVHGDYDADGVTGSTVIITTLREIEKQMKGADAPSCIDFYIPHRDKEGYGLHRETVGKLKERDTKVIITVDCGIACVEEIGLAKGQAIDTIVVDHHQFGETVPDGLLIHPGLPEETYPFKKLAAVGVAYKFATAILADARRRGLGIQEGWEKWLLDLVAIATVTDMVPLIGENRVLEMYGLKVLNKTRRVGLRVLLEQAGLESGKIDTESIGFGIGPRINAAGRMDHASLALRLMLAETQEEAHQLAGELERCNRMRQDQTRTMVEEAEQQLEEQGLLDGSKELPKAILLWSKDWSPALVGLVAGRFMERFSRPVVAIGQHEGNWIGSGRSLSVYDITQAMKTAGEGILTRAGGHIQACGFALNDESRLPELREKLYTHAQEHLTDEQLVPRLPVDIEISLAEVDEDLLESVNQLQPFGEGNPRPVFVTRNVLVTMVGTMGSANNHLRMTVMAGGSMLKLVAFKVGHRAAETKIGDHIDLVYHIGLNEWNGRREMQGSLIDFKVCN